MDFTDGYVLIIGAGGDVPSTIDDAEGVAEILRDPQRCAYPPEQVHLLIGEGATRKAILNALDDLSHIPYPDATVVVYFFGHGWLFSTPKDQYYFMPYGYDTTYLSTTVISEAEFT